MRLALRRKMLFSGALFLFVMVVVESVAYVGVRMLAGTSVIYVPRMATAYAAYLETRHPVLGWPSTRPDDERDAAGARPTPAFPDPTRSASCVALYGDSFTWSSGVEAKDAWGNVLSTLLGCRVVNFGVGGYGTDQAFLRFREHTDDPSPLVVIAHQPENILRNVNQYRGLLYPVMLRFKPRFRLVEDGSLELVEPPLIPVEQYEAFVQRPEDFLEDEYFLPGGRSGVRHARFPFSWTAIRAATHFHVVSELAGTPWYADFYEPDHPSQALQVTAGILEQFAELATERKRTSVLAVLPNSVDLRYRLSDGRWVFETLLVELRRRGLTVHNLGDAILRRLGDEDPCSLFTSCNGHYNPQGERLIAEIMADLVSPLLDMGH